MKFINLINHNILGIYPIINRLINGLVNMYFFTTELVKDKSLIFIENAVTMYTIIEIKFNIFYNWLIKTNLMIYFYSLYTKYMIHEIEMIMDNRIIYSTNKNELYLYNEDNMDFFIYIDKYTYPMNKLICRKKIDYDENYGICSFKFQMIHVKITDNECYLIDLSNKKENYYLVSNVIDKFVICYLLYKQYCILKNGYTISYKLDLIDDKMDFINLNENDIIVLDVNNYKIVHNKNK
jgi:hypothetical protein